MLNALLAACIIVFATDRPSWKEIYWHEIAHCNGWVHPEQGAPVPGKKYIAYKPPARYLYYPKVAVFTNAVTTKRAEQICTGHWGCQCTIGFNCSAEMLETLP